MDKSSTTRSQGMLIIAGVLTWALVAWLGLQRQPGQLGWVMAAMDLGFIALFALLALEWLPRRSQALSKLALLLQAALALGLIRLDAGLNPILLVIWATLLPAAFDKRQAFILLLLVNGAYGQILVQHWQESNPWPTLLIFFGFELFGYSSSLARLGERQARLAQETLNQQLIATRSLLGQASRSEERLRISRDLHDIIGHQLTALSLQLEVLGHKLPEEFRSELTQSKQLARELLGSIRAVVRDQRNDVALDLRQPLQALMVRLPGVSLDCPQTLPLPSAELAQALVLALQEGISNAVRHGQASQLSLTMTQADHRLCCSLSDNGRGLGTTRVKAGSGLSGMQERLAAFNGEVSLHPNPEAAGANLTLVVDLP
ncbi:sensor histidine kinase [Shewanella cyperi]|uniref:sensor histidine kinase n=1 Tax=Shewanella cyperi TaxID=2814292 RepID=UPI001A93F529|nr:histidine kinase [Shewanella cyperi]QSX41245.1 two-component sensor histidine kinase [Shewanella cyperi]